MKKTLIAVMLVLLLTSCQQKVEVTLMQLVEFDSSLTSHQYLSGRGTSSEEVNAMLTTMIHNKSAGRVVVASLFFMLDNENVRSTIISQLGRTMSEEDYKVFSDHLLGLKAD